MPEPSFWDLFSARGPSGPLVLRRSSPYNHFHVFRILRLIFWTWFTILNLFFFGEVFGIRYVLYKSLIIERQSRILSSTLSPDVIPMSTQILHDHATWRETLVPILTTVYKIRPETLLPVLDEQLGEIRRGLGEWDGGSLPGYESKLREDMVEILSSVPRSKTWKDLSSEAAVLLAGGSPRYYAWRIRHDSTPNDKVKSLYVYWAETKQKNFAVLEHLETLDAGFRRLQDLEKILMRAREALLAQKGKIKRKRGLTVKSDPKFLDAVNFTLEQITPQTTALGHAISRAVTTFHTLHANISRQESLWAQHTNGIWGVIEADVPDVLESQADQGEAAWRSIRDEPDEAWVRKNEERLAGVEMGYLRA
ncbi:hypothetical protein FPOAC2_10055 [Fusarium poae]|uniref:hypothetical protein n=1 Tax=Fusarium poae TaxID=36050 RepID=UPI001CE95345|nr:hypothetical protein FPOAC1_007563 [Fusarium poae]KAG8668186.1 hypothetical protein FPOAC1_007563 [Fusarium poae]